MRFQESFVSYMVEVGPNFVCVFLVVLRAELFLFKLGTAHAIVFVVCYSE